LPAPGAGRQGPVRAVGRERPPAARLRQQAVGQVRGQEQEREQAVARERRREEREQAVARERRREERLEAQAVERGRLLAARPRPRAVGRRRRAPGRLPAPGARPGVAPAS
ncbi:MAG TPA: hypothetical protein VFY29_11965, partial [Terriglobia bacterium]|nr:hypothetical protein [Terriglobia bacterium]